MKRIERVASTSVGERSGMTRGAARLMLTATMVAVLAACGGGGGDAGTPAVGGGGGTGGGSTPVVTTPKMTISLSTATVTSTSPATVVASLRTANGTPIAGVVVNFATTGNLGKFDVTSALTNDSGDATVTLTPASATSAGADTVTASASVNGTPLTASGGFQLAATNVTIASLTSDLTTLPPNGETTLTVRLSDAAIGTPVAVALTSACATAGHGTLTPPTGVTTTTGVATFRFRDNSCGSFQTRDTYQASISGNTSTQTLNLPVGAPAAQSIQASSTTTQTIYLKGSGYTEFANVTFRLVDASGNGVPNQAIDLTANIWSGGLTLDGVTQTTLTKNTDNNGDVVVRVNSGTVPTPVRVLAALHSNPSISTVSSALSIAVGLPSQINFSLAQAAPNIEGLELNGTENSYTVIASDRMGNPVPDGTAINFVTEGGQVVSNVFTAKDANGIAKATAKFNTADPRPRDGRVTIVAYALGEESFVDTNGNNVYDAGEDFQDLGAVFLDRLYNNFFNTTDQFIKQDDGSGSTACAASTTEPGKSLFAFSAYTPNKPLTCDGKQGRAYVRRAVETIYSSGTADIVWGTSAPSNLRAPSLAECPSRRDGPADSARLGLVTFKEYRGVDDNGVAVNFDGYSAEDTPRRNLVKYTRVGGGTLYSGGDASLLLSFLVSDSNDTAFNPMPAGSTVSATGTDGLTVTMQGGAKTPGATAPTGANVLVKFADNTAAGTVFITVTSPSGVARTFTQAISKAAVPGAVACP